MANINRREAIAALSAAGLLESCNQKAGRQSPDE